MWQGLLLSLTRALSGMSIGKTLMCSQPPDLINSNHNRGCLYIKLNWPADIPQLLI